MRPQHLLELAALGALLLACAGDAPAGTAARLSSTPTAGSEMIVDGSAFPDDRCELNREAGTITYLTGFDYAAAASIIDVLVADDAGYYEDLCLDVDIRASFSTANYPLVNRNRAQFASGGSFSEVASFAAANGPDLVVTAVEGRTPIEALIVRSVHATDLNDLVGSTIGVKGELPASIEAMMLKAGLAEGEDYDTTLIDGFDPLQHIEIDTIAGFPGHKSNEPGTLRRAGVGFQLFDPSDSGIPGSFGVIYTNAEFIAAHRTAAEDFMRATMMGLADAIADPDAAADIAVALIEDGENPNSLQDDGEVFRWTIDADLIVTTTPEGSPFGMPDAVALQSEIDAYASLGFFGDLPVPDATSMLDNTILGAVYDESADPIWPG